MGWGQKLVLKFFEKAALHMSPAVEVLWSVGAGGEGLQELGAIVGLWPCGLGSESPRLGSAKAMPLCPQLCQARLQPVKSSSQGGAAWGGQQALLPLLSTAWREQQSPARAGKAVSSQQLRNLLLGENFRLRDPTHTAHGCLHRPAAACLALLLLLQNGCKGPRACACPALGTMDFLAGQGVAGLFWRGDAHRAAPWEAA